MNVTIKGWAIDWSTGIRPLLTITGLSSASSFQQINYQIVCHILLYFFSQPEPIFRS